MYRTCQTFKLLQKHTGIVWVYYLVAPLLCDCGLKRYKKSKAPVVDLDAQDLKISSFTAIVFDVRFKLQNLLITTDKIYLIRFYLIRFLIVCECRSSRPINIVLRRTKFYQNLKYKTCTLTFALCLLPVACCFCWFCSCSFLFVDSLIPLSFSLHFWSKAVNLRLLKTTIVSQAQKSWTSWNSLVVLVKGACLDPKWKNIFATASIKLCIPK